MPKSQGKILNGQQVMNLMQQEEKKFLVGLPYSNLYFLVLILMLSFSCPAKYPQIKKLFGSDPNFKWIVSGMITIQLMMIFVVPRLPWPLVIGLAYCFGGVINHSLMLGQFEFETIVL